MIQRRRPVLGQEGKGEKIAMRISAPFERQISTRRRSAMAKKKKKKKIEDLEKRTSIGNDLPAIFLVNFGICCINLSASDILASWSPSSTNSTMQAAAALWDKSVV